MSTTRLKELLGKVVVGFTLSIEEREELLQLMLNFATSEKMLNVDEPAFTFNNISVPKDLYNKVCLILREGRYYDDGRGIFRNKNIISAIKLARGELQCGLKDAKDICESRYFPDYGQYRIDY